jgi:ribosomal protein S15P/S13E
MEAESETAAIDFAFAAEKSLGIPTQRIWARIENEIEVLERKAPPIVESTFWQRLGAFFTPAQFAFAGSLAAVVLVSLFALSSLQKQQVPSEQLAKVNPKSTVHSPKSVEPLIPNSPAASVNEPQVTPIKEIAQNNSTTNVQRATAGQTVYRKAGFEVERAVYNQRSKNLNRTPAVKLPVVESNLASPLAEEREYLDAIANLSQAVETSDEMIMRPSFRVEYEQNVAVMNEAIEKMQKQVRRNPKDENARRILFSSYQNKIDLLSTVSEKSQMMATLQ